MSPTVCRIPACMLPKIVSSSEVYCVAENPDDVLNGVKIAGILGDQQVQLRNNSGGIVFCLCVVQGLAIQGLRTSS